MVSVDANVLLDLYRYPDDRMAATLAAFASLSDRLFVSDQALKEFWRNRMSVLEDRTKAKGEVLKRLSDYQRGVIDATETWAKAITLDDEEELQAINALVERQFDILRARVGNSHSDDTENYPSPALDPIVQNLEPILRGRVGAALQPDIYRECVVEGKSRHTLEKPPGYKEKESDKAHLEEGVAGDYLVWYQSIHEAQKRNLDLLVLTRDEKEDWWWRWRGTVIGPRSELSAEFWHLSGRLLFMMTPLTFLATYKELGGKVSDATLTEARAEANTEARAEARAEARGDVSNDDSDALADGHRSDDFELELTLGGEWSAKAVGRLLMYLDQQAPVQANVIRAAANNGGMINRQSVYAIGNYPHDRML